MTVDTWDRFQKLRAALLASDEFAPSQLEHRLFFRTAQETTGIPIDLIPFGGVSEDDTITWPPHWDTVMTVAGFEDAMAARVRIAVTSDFIIPVVSLASLAVLKIFAWTDRRTASQAPQASGPSRPSSSTARPAPTTQPTASPHPSRPETAPAASSSSTAETLLDGPTSSVACVIFSSTPH